MLAVALGLASASALAQEQPASDVEDSLDAPKHVGVETPFTWVTDPTTPTRGTFVTDYSISNASASGVDRPIAFDATSGVAQTFGVSYGVTSHIAPFAGAIVERDAAGTEGATVSGGLKALLTDLDSPFRLAVVATAFRTFGGSFGSSARFAASYDVGRVRFAANGHFEHVFAEGRDPVDVLVLAGVSFKVLEPLRLGVEYVGQDVEDAFEQDEAEGGARHYVGPNASLDLASTAGHVMLVGGPAIEVAGKNRGTTLGRVALVVAF